jgi:hypothetical protein
MMAILLSLFITIISICGVVLAQYKSQLDLQDQKLLVLKETLEKNHLQIANDLSALKAQQFQIANKTANIITGVGQDNTNSYLILVVIIVFGICAFYYFNSGDSIEILKAKKIADLANLEAAEKTSKALITHTLQTQPLN